MFSCCSCWCFIYSFAQEDVLLIVMIYIFMSLRCKGSSWASYVLNPEHSLFVLFIDLFTWLSLIYSLMKFNRNYKCYELAFITSLLLMNSLSSTRTKLSFDKPLEAGQLLSILNPVIIVWMPGSYVCFVVCVVCCGVNAVWLA